MAQRREELDVLTEQQAADERKLKAIADRIAKRSQKIEPKQEERIAEEDKYLGTIARLLVAEDTVLKRRFVQQSAKVYDGIGDKRARRYLERVLGKIPVTEPAPKPQESDDFEDAAE